MGFAASRRVENFQQRAVLMHPELLVCSLPLLPPRLRAASAPRSAQNLLVLLLQQGRGAGGGRKRRVRREGEKTAERKVGEGRRSSHLPHQSMLLTETAAVTAGNGKWEIWAESQQPRPHGLRVIHKKEQPKPSRRAENHRTRRVLDGTLKIISLQPPNPSANSRNSCSARNVNSSTVGSLESNFLTETSLSLGSGSGSRVSTKPPSSSLAS